MKVPGGKGKIPGGTLLALSLFLAAAPGLSGTFDPSEGITAESIVPVPGDDMGRAHLQALTLGFRQALSAAAGGMTASPDSGRLAKALENPARFVVAYRVEEQDRKDLFYRLKLRVWVDRQLLFGEISMRKATP